MKFVLAPDKYKGSLNGNQFCDAVENGIKQVFPEAVMVRKPLADGGDGTLEVVQDYLNADRIEVTVKDSLFREIRSSYLLSGDKKTAFIEMSEASGYKLLEKKEMNCMHTTTLGTGQLLLDAIERGAENLVLGIGGSATNDAGMGMARALGYRFLDKEGKELEPTGNNLIHVARIDTSEVAANLKGVKVRVACDVNNPLYGPNGAAYVYGPQKGATSEEVKFLDDGLQNMAKVLDHTFGMDVQNISGAGAAGGLGAGAVAFLNGTLASGVDLILDLAQFEEALEGADWIITGEGKLDGQTLSGKTIQGILKFAKAKAIPVAAFCGAIDLTIEQAKALELDYAISILTGLSSLEEAKRDSFKNLELASFNFASLLKRTKTYKQK